MTLPLIRPACTAVALWICIHWVSVDTPDIQKTSFFLSVLQINSVAVLRLDQEGLVEIIVENKEGKDRKKGRKKIVSNNTDC